MVVNSHQKYLANRQIINMLSTMNDDDKRQICLFLSNKNNNEKVINILKDQNLMLEKIYKQADGGSFGREVLANITGDAIWTVAERLIVKLFK